MRDYTIGEVEFDEHDFDAIRASWYATRETEPPLETEDDEPYWTARRVVYLALIAITLLTFLAYTLFTSGLLPLPAPQPLPIEQPFQRA